MKSIRCLIYIVFALCFFISLEFSTSAVQLSSTAEVEEVKDLSLDECVRFSVYNSFEATLAKLDLLIAETDELYSKAVFDTILLGKVGYAQDKRQQISVFAADKTQDNVYELGLSKEFPIGTEVKATWSDERYWVNSPFVALNPSHTAQLLFDVEQPLGKNFFGYIDRNTLTVTKLAIKNASLEMQEKIEDLIANTEKAYWDLVYAKRILDVTEDILARAKELHESNTKNYDLGIIEKGDFYASEANVAVKETNYFIAENNYKKAEDNLKLLINMNELIRLVPTAIFYHRTIEYNLVDCLKRAFEKNRMYKIKERNIKIKNISLKMKENNIFPEIDLKMSMAMNGIDRKFDDAFGRSIVIDNTYYYAGIEVNMPLENSEAESEHTKALHEKEKAIVEFKQTERIIITRVGNFFRDLVTYDTSARNITKAVGLQKAKLEEEVKRFKYGRSTTKNLIDYQNDLLLTEIEEAKVFLDREKAKVNLEREMNILLDKYERLL